MTDDIKKEDALLQPDEKGDDTSVENNVSNDDPSDKLTPEHPRFKQVLERAKEAEEKAEHLEQKMKDLEAKVNERQEETGDRNLTADERAAVDLIEKELRNRKYLTQEDLDKRESINRRESEYVRLKGKHDGSDGYPKFDSEEVTLYAKVNGFGDNFEAAYNDMHRDAIVQVEAKKIAKGNVNVPNSEKPTGGEINIPNTELTPGEISTMSDEDYEKKRAEILKGIKTSVRQ